MQHSAAQHSQHSTARHGTTWHGTPQHSMARSLYLQHVNGSFSTSFMLIGEVGNDEVEVLLQAPVTNRVVQQELQQH